MLHSRRFRVPRCWLQVRCDTRTVQLEVIVVCVGCEAVSCAIGGPIQVLLDGLLVLQRVHEGLIRDRVGRGICLAKVSIVCICASATCPTKGLLRTGRLLLEHIGRRAGLGECVLVQKALLPHHHL